MKTRLSAREICILGILACGLSVTVAHLTSDLAPKCADNRLTFITANESWDNYLEMRNEWRPRILSNLCGKILTIPAAWATSTPEGRLRATAAMHSAGWLLLINVVLIGAFGRRALPLIWGIFAAVAFGYAPGVDTRVYPWDLPGLFFFAVFITLHDRGLYRWLPLVVSAGAFFKETTAVLCVTPLFLDAPWRSRLRQAGLAALAFGVVRITTELIVGNHIPVLSMSVHSTDTGQFLPWSNAKDLFAPQLAHPLWINAGTFLAFLLLPNRNRTMLMLKCVAALFAVNLFVFGIILEFRIWFELAPLAVYALVLHFEDRGEAQPTPLHAGAPPSC